MAVTISTFVILCIIVGVIIYALKHRVKGNK
jgi:hypothetical protein